MNSVTIIVDEDYAEIHNEGGKITITRSQQKYFWAMWYKTKKDYWKYLALKKVGSYIEIPKRQFIGDDDIKLLEDIKDMIIYQIKTKL